MTRKPEHELDRLLSRGKLSGPDRDRVLSHVLEETAREGRDVRPRDRLLALAASAAAVLVIVSVGIWFAGRSAGNLDSAFRAKGNDTGPVIELGCRHGTEVRETTCSPGDTLLFRVDGLERMAYLAAYADGPDGKRVWYFPADDGSMPALEQSPKPRLVDRAVVIGDEHTLGRNLVTVLLFSTPLRRDAISSTPPLQKRSFEIELSR